MKKIYLYIIAALTCTSSLAQDMQYSQFYAAPLYMNPAFAGANSCSRLATNYRQQWPGIPGNFSSYLVSYDHTFPKKNFAIGAMITKDQAGAGNLGSTSGNLIYAYQLNLTRKWTINTGFQAGVVTRSVNFYDLYFVDQLVTGSSSTVEVPLSERVTYFDFSTGMLAFSRRFWAGFSTHHLNTPNQAMINETSKLPIKYSLHMGWQLPTGRSSDARRKINERSITPALNYKKQGDFQQLDMGVYYQFEALVLGAWYRGIPLLKTTETNTFNTDGIIFVAGVTKNRFNFGYSYDITLSQLSSATTRGAHELSVSYQFCDYNALKKKRKVQRFIPCAKF
jgi:type IX secretion system PorP/SprF family membrane protein